MSPCLLFLFCPADFVLLASVLLHGSSAATAAPPASNALVPATISYLPSAISSTVTAWWSQTAHRAESQPPSVPSSSLPVPWDTTTAAHDSRRLLELASSLHRCCADAHAERSVCVSAVDGASTHESPASAALSGSPSRAANGNDFQGVLGRIECSVSLRQFRAFMYQLEYEHGDCNGAHQSALHSAPPTAVAATALVSATAARDDADDADEERSALSDSSSNSSLPSFGSDVELDLPFDSAPPAKPKRGAHLESKVPAGTGAQSSSTSEMFGVTRTAAIVSNGSIVVSAVSDGGTAQSVSAAAANGATTTTAMLAAAWAIRGGSIVSTSGGSGGGGWDADALSALSAAAALTWAAWRSGVGSAADLWTHAVHSCLGESVSAATPTATATAATRSRQTAAAGAGIATSASAADGTDKLGALFRFLVDGRSIRARLRTPLNAEPPHETVRRVWLRCVVTVRVKCAVVCSNLCAVYCFKSFPHCQSARPCLVRCLCRCAPAPGSASRRPAVCRCRGSAGPR